MLKIIFTSLMIGLMGYYVYTLKHNEKIIKQLEKTAETIQVKATFSDKESTNDPSDSCFMLEKSKRSFDNAEYGFNQNTKFELVQIVDGDTICLREVLANGKTFLKPETTESCIKDYKIPPTYCRGGKHCVKVVDHCY